MSLRLLVGWTRGLGARAWLGLASLAFAFACTSVAPGAGVTTTTPTSLVLEVLGPQAMTRHRQQVELVVAEESTGRSGITATADLPAYSTSKDFAGLLAFILTQKGHRTETRESVDPAHTAVSSEELRLPPGLVVTQVTVKKKVGEAWLESGPDDLRVHLGGVRSEP